MQGARRVITFCLLIAVLPVILLIVTLYLRHSVYQDVSYDVADSEIVEIVDGISSLFCQEHSLQMNSTFNAFQVKGSSAETLLSEQDGNLNRSFPSLEKHVRLKKSMSLADDTLEYWGFYLPGGSTVLLSVCSRFQGPSLLVVKGEKHLKKCGLLELAKEDGAVVEGQGKVSVKFDSPASIKSEKVAESREEIEYEGEVTDDSSIQESRVEIGKLQMTGRDSLNSSISEANKTHRHRHTKSRHKNSHNAIDAEEELLEHRKQILAEELNLNPSPQSNVRNVTRKKRLVPVVSNPTLDSKKFNITSKRGNDSSVSSFENSLLTCYRGQILLSQGFYPSEHCNDTAYLENGKHLDVQHDVEHDGYYYYIFYSDNDDVQNDIHAIFNIYKPTYHHYSNSCVNKTECNFSISFMTDEIVIVEVPIRDGLKQHNNTKILMSRCHPRSAIYAIFPITILFLILVCSFL